MLAIRQRDISMKILVDSLLQGISIIWNHDSKLMRVDCFCTGLLFNILPIGSLDYLTFPKLCASRYVKITLSSDKGHSECWWNSGGGMVVSERKEYNNGNTRACNLTLYRFTYMSRNYSEALLIKKIFNLLYITLISLDVGDLLPARSALNRNTRTW